MNPRPMLYGCAGVCGALALGAAWMGSGGIPAWNPELVSAPSSAETFSTTTPNTYFVTKVVDGDTDDVIIDGKTVRLRLVGMDTPEVVDPRKVVQCFGKEASAEGHKLLEGQWVRLEFDAVAGTYDRYGRMLAYVFLTDGTFYNEYMIAQGYAHEYTYNGQHYKYQVEFKAAQKEAQQDKRGFWADDTCAGNTTHAAKPAS